jgi:hypothetical protein
MKNTTCIKSWTESPKRPHIYVPHYYFDNKKGVRVRERVSSTAIVFLKTPTGRHSKYFFAITVYSPKGEYSCYESHEKLKAELFEKATQRVLESLPKPRKGYSWDVSTVYRYP